MSHEDIKARVDAVAKQLGEHCDSVRIFVTIPTEAGISAGMTSGCGNLYAQYGQIHEWVIMQNQYARCEAIRRDADDNDGE